MANGTDLQAVGRWRDANFVRWKEGTMQPVGGWVARTGPGSRHAGVARGMHAWLDNSGTRHIAFGTPSRLYHLSQTVALTDVSPSGLTSGTALATTLRGFGISTFGTGLFGTARPDTGVLSEATTWSMDNWGQNLVACSTADGKLYEWPLTGSAAQISNSPESCDGLVVTEERFLFALGADGNRRKIAWSDQEDNTTWTPTSTNQAGDQELQCNGRIMQALQVRGQTLILTDREAYVANYLGPPFVYGFEKVGDACGTISRRAAAPVAGGAVWMGPNGFYRYQGGAVEEIPCEVSERVFASLPSTQASIVHAVSNSLWNEIWWFYPSAAGQVADRVVIWNYAEGWWSLGQLDRSAGIDRGVFDVPIMIRSGGPVYDHETGATLRDNGRPYNTPFAESGPIGMDGEMFTLNEVIPDEAAQGDVLVTFRHRAYPNAQEKTAARGAGFGSGAFGSGAYWPAGSYGLDKLDYRFTARQARLRIAGMIDTAWRWGRARLRMYPRGRR